MMNTIQRLNPTIMNKKTTLLFFALVMGIIPVSAAEADSGFSELLSGPNLTLAIIALIQLIAIISVGSIIKKLTRNTDYFVKLKKLRESEGLKVAILMIGFSGLSLLANAQEATEAVREQAPLYPEFARDPNSIMLLGLNVILLLVFIYMTRLLRSTVAMLMPEIEEEPQTVAEAQASGVMHALTDAIPLEREHEVMMDHEYDGIRELDNNLPPWWVWMFYVTIAFAFVYMVYFHVLPYGQSQEEQYIAEVEAAEEAKAAYLAMAKNLVDESNVEMLSTESDLNAGKAIFVEKCQQCHAADGGGGVGPNLTDEYWIHGGSIQDIFKTVKYGVPAKGMISWESQLRPNEMAQVSSYIKSLMGTQPANPKEPQGDVWVEQVETEQPADSVQSAPNEETTEEEIDSQTAAL